MYRKPPDASKLGLLGLTPDMVAEPAPVIWPELEPAVRAFAAMGTQWRVGMAGATGLDYTALMQVFRMQLVPRSQWPEMLQDVQVLERSALAQMIQE